MIFNQTIVYALRAMHYLAASEDDTFASSRDVSQVTSVPPHYLLKIMKKLAEAGLVETKKGHHGGFRLARASEEVTVAEILLAMDVPLYTPDCAFGWDTCDGNAPCPLHEMWMGLKERVIDWAATTTLKQMEPPSAALSRG